MFITILWEGTTALQEKKKTGYELLNGCGGRGGELPIRRPNDGIPATHPKFKMLFKYIPTL